MGDSGSGAANPLGFEEIEVAASGTDTRRLEAAGYIRRGRVLTTAGFQVRLRITPEGDAAFRAYLEALRAYFLVEPVEPHRQGGGPPPALP